jgi:ACT domain-containing protein
MADYAITFASSARKELEALERKHVERVFRRIEGLGRERQVVDIVAIRHRKDVYQ